MRIGGYTRIGGGSRVLYYVRHQEDERILVVLNFSHLPAAIAVESETFAGTVLLSTAPGRTGARIAGRIELDADEAIVVILDRAAALSAIGPELPPVTA